MIAGRPISIVLSFLVLVLLVSACSSIQPRNDELKQGTQRIDFRFVPVPAGFDAPPNGTSFNPHVQILPIERRTQVVGIPEDLAEVTVLHAFVDGPQYFYQALHAGLISQEFFERVRVSVGNDTTVLTREWVDGAVATVVVGQDPDGRTVVLADQNGDGDFSMERPLTFAPDTLYTFGRSVPIQSARASFTFEYWDDGEIRTRTAPVRLFYREDADPTDLGWQIMEYAVGTWEVGGEQYHVALGTQAVFRSTDWEYFFIDVDDDGAFDTDPTGLEAYQLSQPFNIGGIGWSLRDIDPGGGHIVLSETDIPVSPRTALREGIAAPQFEALSVDGERVSLDELHGRYVLLNFAASWCPFSRAEIPFLKEANSTFSSEDLIIVSLVDDTQGSGFEAYLREFAPEWPQIHQNRTDDISRLYRILGFPTNYLLSDTGMIVSSGSDLRGEQLIETLRSHLGP